MLSFRNLPRGQDVQITELCAEAVTLNPATQLSQPDPVYGSLQVHVPFVRSHSPAALHTLPKALAGHWCSQSGPHQPMAQPRQDCVVFHPAGHAQVPVARPAPSPGWLRKVPLWWQPKEEAKMFSTLLV